MTCLTCAWHEQNMRDHQFSIGGRLRGSRADILAEAQSNKDAMDQHAQRLGFDNDADVQDSEPYYEQLHNFIDVFEPVSRKASLEPVSQQASEEAEGQGVGTAEDAPSSPLV